MMLPESNPNAATAAIVITARTTLYSDSVWPTFALATHQHLNHDRPVTACA
jgi:hypothetical protein